MSTAAAFSAEEMTTIAEWVAVLEGNVHECELLIENHLLARQHEPPSSCNRSMTWQSSSKRAAIKRQESERKPKETALRVEVEK